MFYFLKGNIAHKGENFIALDVNGVGFKIYTSINNISKAQTGEEATFLTYVYLREDIFDIYGFATHEELSFFELLISVSGVGPKAALSVLSALSPSDIITAVVTNDSKAISRAQGVGTKIAQRIILELKGKIPDADIAAGIRGDGGYSDFLSTDDSNEAVSALISLGYSSLEARRAVAAVENASGVEETLKEALKRMMK